MAILRYGQGQDYFNYEIIYDSVAAVDNFSELFFVTDIGFGVLTYAAVRLSISFYVYSAFLSGVSMLLFYKFLKEQCNYSFLGLFVFYAVIFLIYPTSSLRQSLCMAVFFSIMLPLLNSNKWEWYYIIGCILVTFHLSSFIYLFLPIVKWVGFSKKKGILIFLFSCVLLFLNLDILKLLPIPYIKERLFVYTEAASNHQILAKLVRIFLVLPMICMSPKYFKDKRMSDSVNFFLFGFFVYAATSFSEIGSSRMWGFFLGFGCIILSKLSLSDIKTAAKRTMITYYVCILCVLWFKDIDAIIGQGHYKNCNMFTYPYISIIEGDKTLDQYRMSRGEVDSNYF